MTITIADGRGALWQWDTGRRVKVTDGNGVKQIHYQNKCLGRSVDVDISTDGTAIIPDELLQDYHRLTAYAYAADDTGAYTMVQQDFAVYKRAKPADYVYTPTEHAGFDRLRSEIGDLSDLTTEAKDTLVAAINEVALSSGTGSMSLRVADGHIQYSTDSGETWANLIAVADLKGADGAKGDKGDTGAPGQQGPQGEPGVKGADGVTPTIGENGDWYIGDTDTGKPSRGEKGEKGEPGSDGAPGAPGAPGAKGDKGETGPQGPKGDPGAAGTPGKDGVPGKDGADGKPGAAGADGAKGADGITPTIGSNGNWYLGTTDTGKPSRGATGAKGTDGANGKDGAQGEKGADGHTPVKGTDYWTAADKQEIVSSVLAALPDGTEVSY